MNGLQVAYSREGEGYNFKILKQDLPREVHHELATGSSPRFRHSEVQGASTMFPAFYPHSGVSMLHFRGMSESGNGSIFYVNDEYFEGVKKVCLSVAQACSNNTLDWEDISTFLTDDYLFNHA